VESVQHADSQKFLTYLQEQAETRLSSAIDEVGNLRTQFLSGGGRPGNTNDERELRDAFSTFVDARAAASSRLEQMPEQSGSPAAGSPEQSGSPAEASLEQTESPAAALCEPTGSPAEAPTALLADASLTGPGAAPIIASQPSTNALLTALLTGQQQLVQQNQMMMGFMAVQQQQFHQLAGAFGAQIQHTAPITLVNPFGQNGAAQAPALQLQETSNSTSQSLMSAAVAQPAIQSMTQCAAMQPGTQSTSQFVAQPITQPMAQPMTQPMAQSAMQPLLQMAPFAHPVSMQHSSQPQQAGSHQHTGALPAEAQAQPSALMQTPTNTRPNQQQSVTPSLTLNFGNPYGT
jgi:hypothetical protein